MRWPGILGRFAGWLLAPLVVWAVSLWGAWIAFGLTAGLDSPRDSLLIGFTTAVLLGTATLLLWMRLLRKLPRLRKSLRVTREGLPRIEEEIPEPHTEPTPSKEATP